MRLALGNRYKRGWIKFRLGRDMTHNIRWAFGFEWKYGFVGVLLTEPDAAS